MELIPGRDGLVAVTSATVRTICCLAVPIRLGVAREQLHPCLLRVWLLDAPIPPFLFKYRQFFLGIRTRSGMGTRRPVRDPIRSRRNPAWAPPQRGGQCCGLGCGSDGEKRFEILSGSLTHACTVQSRSRSHGGDSFCGWRPRF